MGPLRSALAAARRQRRRRGVFVSLYRPCCGAAAAIARRRRGPAGSPHPPHPPARPPSRRRARPPAAAATEARALATPFSFLCLCPRGRLLARPIARPRPALCPPPLPRRMASQPRGDLCVPASAPPLLKSPDRQLPHAQPGLRAIWVSSPWRRLSGCPFSSLPGPRHLPGRLASVLRRLAARRSLLVRASPPLVSVSTEWRRRRCCGCE